MAETPKERKQVGLRLKNELWLKIVQLSFEMKISRNQLMETAINEYLNKRLSDGKDGIS
jgi:hypothetical protein